MAHTLPRKHGKDTDSTFKVPRHAGQVAPRWPYVTAIPVFTIRNRVDFLAEGHPLHLPFIPPGNVEKGRRQAVRRIDVHVPARIGKPSVARAFALRFGRKIWRDDLVRCIPTGV
eukprot:1185626-Prorocentrum_minimum.AAC.3